MTPALRLRRFLVAAAFALPILAGALVPHLHAPGAVQAAASETCAACLGGTTAVLHAPAVALDGPSARPCETTFDHHAPLASLARRPSPPSRAPPAS